MPGVVYNTQVFPPTANGVPLLHPTAEVIGDCWRVFLKRALRDCIQVSGELYKKPLYQNTFKTKCKNKCTKNVRIP